MISRFQVPSLTFYSQIQSPCRGGVSLALIAANRLASGLEQPSVRVRQQRLHIKRPPCRLAHTFPDGNTARIRFHVWDGALCNFTGHHKTTTRFLFRDELEEERGGVEELLCEAARFPMLLRTFCLRV